MFFFLKPISLLGQADSAMTSDLSGSLTIQDTSKALQEVYDLIQTQYYETGNIDENAMSRQAVASFVNTLWDPFSSYLEPLENKDFTEALEWMSTLEGIGAYLSKKDAGVIVEQVVKASPAAQAWIKALDMIVKVNGSGIQHLSLPEVVAQIRGERGTTVDLTLVRAGTGGMEFFEKKVTRDTISIPSVTSKLLTGSDSQVFGYLALSIFWEETNTLMMKELNGFLKNNIDWLILDLRANGGGLLPEAVTIASHFLPLGTPVVTAKYRLYSDQTYTSEWTNDISVPVVILVDEWTASASEILALALRESLCLSDSDCATPFPCPALKEGRDACIRESRVLIVGQKTFGKWSIQVLQPVSFGGSVKLTVGKRFSPSWKTIDHEWIEPDLVIPFDADRYYKDGYDTQLEKAIAILSQKQL